VAPAIGPLDCKNVDPKSTTHLQQTTKRERQWGNVSKISEPVAARVRAEFLPKEATDPDRIAGLDEIMPDAVKLKYIPAPLAESQLKELIQVPLK
jgi:NitT/TauT family transport system substrate-binding protein